MNTAGLTFRGAFSNRKHALEMADTLLVGGFGAQVRPFHNVNDGSATYEVWSSAEASPAAKQILEGR